MEYRNLGRSGLKVSPLCLGTMMFGDQTDAKEADRIVAAARDAGVNFVDTADGYAKGESERILGRLLKKDRDRWVVATKVAVPMGKEPNERGLSRRWMMQAIDRSLERLQMDHVDIWYLHQVDYETPLEETVGAMGEIIAAGKVRYWGFSNHRAWQIGELVWLADRLGAPRPIIAQPYYNAMNRMPETEYLPACEYYGIGVVPYSPLARGVLTGKYEPGRKPPKGTRAGRNDRRIMMTEFREESMVAARKIKAHAEKRGMTAIDYAVLWVLNNRIVTSVIGGPRTLAQWQGYLGALQHEFTAEDEALLDSLVPAGHPSTPGYTDPQNPVLGRKPRTG